MSCHNRPPMMTAAYLCCPYYYHHHHHHHHRRRHHHKPWDQRPLESNGNYANLIIRFSVAYKPFFPIRLPTGPLLVSHLGRLKQQQQQQHLLQQQGSADAVIRPPKDTINADNTLVDGPITTNEEALTSTQGSSSVIKSNE